MVSYPAKKVSASTSPPKGGKSKGKVTSLTPDEMKAPDVAERVKRAGPKSRKKIFL